MIILKTGDATVIITKYLALIIKNTLYIILHTVQYEKWVALIINPDKLVTLHLQD